MGRGTGAVQMMSHTLKSSASSPVKKARKLLSDILGKATEPTPRQSVPVEVSIRREFEIYAVNQDACHIDADPLVWWKVNHHSYPLLSQLAQKYLCVTATSCSSERLFSVSGNIVTKKRTALKPHRVDQLVFLACNCN